MASVKYKYQVQVQFLLYLNLTLALELFDLPVTAIYIKSVFDLH